MKIAAVDIGSNAMRLLIMEASKEHKNWILNKEAFWRVPLRLGAEVFSQGELSQEKQELLIKALSAFKILMELQKVDASRIVATAALREARNGAEIQNKVQERLGLKLDIIGGTEEADLIFALHAHQNLPKKKAYLFIDVGGGSTELTLFASGKKISSASFKVGTIRLLENKVDPEALNQLSNYVKNLSQAKGEILAVGTGGNINKLLKLVGKKNNSQLSIKLLKQWYEHISQYSLEDRIRFLGLREDRADVIVPALYLYYSIMNWANIGEILIPKVGLADAVIHQLFSQKQSTSGHSQHLEFTRVILKQN